MGITFSWLYSVCFPFIGKILGVISSFATSAYTDVSIVLRNFFSNTVQQFPYVNLFTGQPSVLTFMSALPDVLNFLLNLVNKIVWWALDFVVKLFNLSNQPFVFAVFAVFAVFFLPFFGFRFVRMLVG